MDVTSISCSSSEVPSPVSSLPVMDNQSDSMIPNSTNTSNTTVNLSIVKPKIENSPPPATTSNNYGDQIQRQTVLMWGSGVSHSDQSMEARTPPSQIKSPMCHGEPYTSKQNQNNDSKKHGLADDSHQQQNPKWNESVNRDSKVLPVYSMQENMNIYSAINNQQANNEAPMTNENNNMIVDEEMPGSNCEVWPPTTYSQYQYITYHHGPNHHQQHICTQ